MTALLEARNLRRAFGGLVAVDALDLTVARGEVLGLLGPNGSGKTTALNLLSGALRPDTGTVHFRGQAITGLPAHRIARRGIARTFQLVRILPSLTVLENAMAGIAFRPGGLWGAPAARAAQDLLDRVGLAGHAGRPAGDLTYIDQKRLELARALALQPELLLLDEWLAGLTPSELQEAIALVRSLTRDGVTILLVEHVMEAVRSLCDHLVVMSAGRKIAEGPMAAVLADPAVIAAYLGDEDA